MHHFFAAAKLVEGEGAELRGTLTDGPLPSPYYVLTNGSELQPPIFRYANPCTYELREMEVASNFLFAHTFNRLIGLITPELDCFGSQRIRVQQYACM